MNRRLYSGDRRPAHWKTKERQRRFLVMAWAGVMGGGHAGGGCVMVFAVDLGEGAGG